MLVSLTGYDDTSVKCSRELAECLA